MWDFKFPYLIHVNRRNPSCQCNFGYEGSGIQCSEIDPCSKPDRGGCHHEATCTKTGPGTNNCTCDDGFRGDGTVCVAIDPCLEENGGGCHSNAECQYVSPGQVSELYINSETISRVIFCYKFYFSFSIVMSFTENVPPALSICYHLVVFTWPLLWSSPWEWGLGWKWPFCILMQFVLTEHLYLQVRLHRKWFNMFWS